MAAAAPYYMSDFFNNTALGLMRTLADSMANMGSANPYRGGEMLVEIPPRMPLILRATDGRSKTSNTISSGMHASRMLRLDRGMYNEQVRQELWPGWIACTRDDVMIPLVRTPDEILVIVGAGSGRHSAWVRGWSNVDRSRSVTKLIRA